jgi:o-succinylbenzoate synthase
MHHLPLNRVWNMRFVTYSIGMHTRFRGIEVREGMLIEGSAGWGEFSPFAEYDDAVSVSWLRAALESACHPLPPPVRERIPVNCTIPAVAPQDAARIVRASGGCRTAKVKVAERGQGPGDDLARVEAVRDALGSGGSVRVDANGGWSVDEAVQRINALARFELEYVEQPCATVDELARVRRRVEVPIAADESIRTAGDPYRVKSRDAADIAVLKVQPLGGVRACLHIAERIGLPVVVSSAVETSVGIAAGVALAAALPELPYACGLATVQLLRRDVVPDPLLPVDGQLSVRRPSPDPAALAASAADARTEAAWQDRLARVKTLLGDDR